MKAILLTRYGSPADLEVRDVPRPEPGPEEVLIQVRAASVNDWDWGLVRGKPFYIRLFCGLRKPRIQIPGVDVAGVVVSVGAQVREWQPGDRVFGDLSESGFGAFAEYVCARQDAIARAPSTLSFEQAAALPHAAALARQGLCDVARLRPDDRLLVNGAGGGVGTLAVQMARDLGVTGITGVDAASKHECMRAIGYDEVVDYRECDFTRSGERYSVILDTRTNRPAHAYARALRPGGRYVTVGGRTDKLLRVALLGLLIGRISGKQLRVLALKANKDLAHIRELCEEGRLEPVVDQVCALEEVPRAIRRFGGGEHLGKIVMSVGE